MHCTRTVARAAVVAALLAAVTLLPASTVGAAMVSTAEPSSAGYAGKVFDKSTVASVALHIDASDWQWLLDNATLEEFRSCDITIGGTTWYDVGIRPKGNSSLARVANSTSDRFSFKVKFDEYIPGQTCYGLQALVLNNIMDDATYMKEYMSYELFAALDVATPVYAYADITVNDKDWGLYLMVEVIDTSFVQRIYGTTSGNLYKPEGVDVGARGKFVPGQEAVQGEAPPQGGGMPGGSGTNLAWVSDDADDYSVLRDSAVLASTDDEDFARLIAMMKALHDGTGIEDTVDVDEVLRYFAVNTFLVNLDSYASSLKHNYYLYERDGVFQILPWDLNLSFAGFQPGSAASVINFPVDIPVSDSMENSPLIASLLAVDDYKNLYHGYLQQLVTQEITSGDFEAEVARIDALIEDAVDADATAFVTYERYRASLPVLVQFAKDRAASITAQLAGQQSSTSTGTVATTVDLDILGSAAGRTDTTAPGQPEDVAPGGGVADRTVMQQAMAIIRSTAGGELSDKQKKQLIALGLDEAAVARLQQMPAVGQRPGGQGVDGAGQPPFGQAGVPQDLTASTARADISSLALAAFLCAVLLGAGIAYVGRFRTRRYQVPTL